ncbi:MAG: diphosphomevalonate decarboxylase [Pseudomonadales bacterium]
MATVARAHPNIALIKYWGKAEQAGNVPATPSLSITLDTLETVTSVETAARDQLLLNGERVEDEKVLRWLEALRAELDVPHLQIETRNNFPTAAGLASSASGFAALMTAIDAHCGLGLDAAARSDYARRGSGSAARSAYGGFVTLQAPDWRAAPLLAAGQWPLRVLIAVTTRARKNRSSSDGMRLSAATSPFFPAWVSSTAADFEHARGLVERRDFAGLAELSEHSCLKMHGLMLSTRPGLVYWNPTTVALILRVRELRAEGVPVFFTVDAGPQVKAVCLPDAEAHVAAALRDTPGVLDVLHTGLGQGAEVISR